jgi:putative toxin-antitoxin system antitoxin component (TIGR02293 family)
MVFTQFPNPTLTDLVGTRGSAGALIDAVREGLPYATFEEVREALGISGKELAALMGVPARTLNTRKHAGRFTPQESDHLLRIARVYARAHDFFGTQHQASAWLKKPALAFGEHTPLSMCDTELGAEQVMTLLYQLEYGVLP